MKFILELILAIIIVFFVWNILKRLFFNSFYNLPKQETKQQPKTNSPKMGKQKLNWDAETVEYEEVKEEKQKK